MNKLITLLIFLIFAISFTSPAKDSGKRSGKGQIGLTFSSFGSNDLMSFRKTVGGPGYTGNGFKTFGLIYLIQLNRTLDFEIGIEYSEHKITLQPNLPLIYNGTTNKCKLLLVNIPANLQVNFLKYFFLNGGIFLDFDAGNSGLIKSQRGLGANIGLGLNYNFNGWICLFVNPYTKVHSLFLSKEIDQRLTESGFRFGILVRLNK